VSRRLRAYVAILVGALAAGVPVALLLRGLDNYIEREARDEARLAAQPTIGVPTIALDGADDGVSGPEASARHGRHFTGPYQRRVVANAGHNLPQEQPRAFADAVLELVARDTPLTLKTGLE